MARTVCPGEIYRHFKGNLYQIVAVASHSETGEKMVVYQALYGDFQVYVRPFEMFVSEVDREKYPDAVQQYRFEKTKTGERGEEFHFSGSVEIQEEEEPLNPSNENVLEQKEKNEKNTGPNQALMDFLDAKSLEEKIGYLKKMKASASQSDLESIYVVLDMHPQSGTVSEQLDGIISFLAMQKHYEGGRLR